MERYFRHPRQVVGNDPTLLAHWNKMSGHVRLRLLESSISVSTLGELKLLEEDLDNQTTVPPEAF